MTMFDRWYARELEASLDRPFVHLMFGARQTGKTTLLNALLPAETGLSQPTIKSHYQLLEDMFIGLRVPAYSGSKRKHVLSSPKFLLFDLGVRHAAAGLKASPELVKVNPGAFFEQWVGLELWKRLQYLGQGHLHCLRTRDGMEIDFILERSDQLIPIEVVTHRRSKRHGVPLRCGPPTLDPDSRRATLPTPAAFARR